MGPAGPCGRPQASNLASLRAPPGALVGGRQASGHREPRRQHPCSRRLSPRVLSSVPRTLAILWKTGAPPTPTKRPGRAVPSGASRGRQTPCPVPARRTARLLGLLRPASVPGSQVCAHVVLDTRGGRGLGRLPSGEWGAERLQRTGQGGEEATN